MNTEINITARTSDTIDDWPIAMQWVDLFSKNRHCEVDIVLYPIEQDSSRVRFSEGDVQPINDAMGFYLMGKFLGWFPG